MGYKKAIASELLKRILYLSRIHQEALSLKFQLRLANNLVDHLYLFYFSLKKACHHILLIRNP